MKIHVLTAISLVFSALPFSARAVNGYQIFNENGAALLNVIPLGLYAGIFAEPKYHSGLPCYVSVETIDMVPKVLRVKVDLRNPPDPAASWMINDFPLREGPTECGQFVASVPYHSPYGEQLHYTNRFGATANADATFVVEGQQAKEKYRCVDLRPVAPISF